MKINKKILIFLISLHILTVSSISVELSDCSIYSKLNPKYVACKAGNFVKDTKIIKAKSGLKKKVN
jgi:outer membrane protein assembly factor BamE (lipoprotein component of BamABCDE complex)|tara:strand:+ start:195 stop:392 length:198 start_codon:yes stop_codon:yes gene_type:complete